MPDYIQEVLKIKVAHFDPVTVSVVGQGVYPALSLTLPRARSAEYDQALIEAQDSLRAARSRPQPPLRSAYYQLHHLVVLYMWSSQLACKCYAPILAPSSTDYVHKKRV